jgi:LPXTG-site transpeptidase (sortase) family protein
MRALTKNFAKIPLVLRAVSLYVVVGIGAWGAGSIIGAYTPEPVQANQVVNLPKKKILSEQILSGHPISFAIEELGINLPIRDGVYNTQTNDWTLSGDAVFFAALTTEPNEASGNTFIYGHNQPQVIGPMKDIAVGDIVTNKTSNGHTFLYEYVRDAIIAPTFTEVLREDPKTPQLTVMTCEGIWSETRRLMYFDLVEVV